MQFLQIILMSAKQQTWDAIFTNVWWFPSFWPNFSRGPKQIITFDFWVQTGQGSLVCFFQSMCLILVLPSPFFPGIRIFLENLRTPRETAGFGKERWLDMEKESTLRFISRVPLVSLGELLLARCHRRAAGARGDGRGGQAGGASLT